MKQRYISKELTHFVGRKCDNEGEKYNIIKKSYLADFYLILPTTEIKVGT